MFLHLLLERRSDIDGDLSAILNSARSNRLRKDGIAVLLDRNLGYRTLRETYVRRVNSGRGGRRRGEGEKAEKGRGGRRKRSGTDGFKVRKNDALIGIKETIELERLSSVGHLEEKERKESERREEGERKGTAKEPGQSSSQWRG